MPFDKKHADDLILMAQRDAGQGEIDYNTASLQSAQIAIAINLGRIADALEKPQPSRPFWPVGGRRERRDRERV
jgi:hypothetical protein